VQNPAAAGFCFLFEKNFPFNCQLINKLIFAVAKKMAR